jgi:hypothetical protein
MLRGVLRRHVKALEVSGGLAYPAILRDGPPRPCPVGRAGEHHWGLAGGMRAVSPKQDRQAVLLLGPFPRLDRRRGRDLPSMRAPTQTPPEGGAFLISP